jgi:hypothetical protein
MSLERIDRYIKELTAIRDYSAKCLELNNTYKLISEMQKELNEKETLISISKDTIEEQVATIIYLSNMLGETQEALKNLGRGSRAVENNPLFKTDQFGKLLSLDIQIDAPNFVSWKKKKEKEKQATCSWLLENRYFFF